MTKYQEVLTAARNLDASERVLLATTLWDELDMSDAPLPDPEVLAEAERRLKNYEEGKTTAAPWEEVLERVTKAAVQNG